MSKGKAKGAGKQAPKAAAAPTASSGGKVAPLPQHQTRKPADNKLFDSLSNLYERKNYKQGIKLCEQLLKKYPEDGETLSMKALFISGMPGRKEEAYELARKGLRLSMKSHVPWHIFGLLYRADGNYDQSIRSYLNALVHDPKNSTLQMRDVAGWEVSRAKLLDMKKSQKGNWAAYAVALHMNQKFTSSLKILGILQNSFASKVEEDLPERSERILYHNMVMEESGDIEGALRHLKENKADIKDRIGYLEKKAEYLLKLKRPAEALNSWKKLLLRNPDELRYHSGAIQALELPEIGKPYTVEQLQKLKEFWQPLQEAHPRSPTFDSLSLSLMSGADFEAVFLKRLCTQLRKGIPSLFSGMRHLYEVPEKADAIEAVILKAEKSLREHGTLPDKKDDQPPEPPTTLLWLICYLACHFSQRGQYERALRYIKEAEDEHTPTMHELYMIKADILKQAGSLREASAQMEFVRQLDTADRFLNTKSVKYLLKANKPDEATTVVQLFTKDNDDFEPAEKGQTYLDYMQAMWWESRLAACYERLGNVREALRLQRLILGHFKGILEDQFDFHSYVLRKMTLRAYMQLLRFEDHIFAHKHYRLAALGAIRLALRIDKNPPPPEEMVPEPKKKGLPKKEDNEEKDKLPTLDTFVPEMNNLLKFAGDDIRTQILAAKLFQARNKPLLVLRALKAALRLDESSPALHVRLISFLVYKKTLENLQPVVLQALTAETELLAHGTIEEIAKKWLENHKSSQVHRIAAAKAALVSGNKSVVVSLLKDLTNATLVGTEKAKKYLKRHGSEADLENFVAEARKLFPLADFLAPPQLTVPASESENSADTVEMAE